MDIEAPQQRVWDVLTDLERWPERMETVDTVELLTPHLTEPVNVINVEHLARQRGIEMVQVHEAEPPQGMVGDVVGVRVSSQDGQSHRILGTAYLDRLPRVLRIDDFNMDMVPEGHMVIIVNKDQPGVIGTVGTTFGVIFFISCIGMGLGSYGGGVIYDHLGSYWTMHLASTMVGAAAIVVALGLRAPARMPAPLLAGGR